MLKILQNKRYDGDIKANFLIMPQNLYNLAKIKYVSQNIEVLTISSLVNKLFLKVDNRKKVSNVSSFMLMYKAFYNVKDKLKLFSDINDISLINGLLNQYWAFNDYEKKLTKKVSDLKVIYQEYESLLENKSLITNKKMFSEVCKNIAIKDSVFIFDGFDRLSNDELNFINALSKYNHVYLYVDTVNNESFCLKLGLPYIQNKDNSKKLVKSCNDITDEINFVLNDITKNVLNGMEYKDFIVVSNDLMTYEPYINMNFDIPYENTDKKGVLTSRFIKYFSNIVKGDLSCKSFMNLLFLDIFKITKEELEKLDNYIYTWNLENENFYDTFIYNPNKNSKTLTETDKLNLQEINDVKNGIILPIVYLFKNVIKETNIKEILKYFFTYLEEEGITNRLFEKDAEGYQLLISSLDDISNNLENASFIEIIDILNEVIKPVVKKNNYLDAVSISNLQDACYENKKIIYFIGFIDTLVPNAFSFNGLLNEEDYNDDVINEIIKEHSDYEKHLIYNALSKDTIITYPRLSSDFSSKVNPSNLLLDLNIEHVENDKIYSKKLSIDYYAKLLSKQNAEKIRDDNSIVSLMNDANLNKLEKRLDKNVSQKLYTKCLSLSPSSIETYAKCPFSFFCKYGLKIKVKEKNAFDNRFVGTLVHFILYDVLKNHTFELTINNVYDFVFEAVNKYINNELVVVNDTVKYFITHVAKNTVSIIKNMVLSFDVDKFRPSYLEFRISDDAEIKPVIINNHKVSVSLKGVVDRIDVYETKEEYYFRIIDYKTGSKTFRLDETLAGLNLQMLIYLLAFKESKKTDKKIIPAGFFYYPALIKGGKAEKLSGMTKLDKGVLDCIGKEASQAFNDLYTRGHLNEEKIFNDKELELIIDEVKKVINDISLQIIDGVIDVSPVMDKNDACSYCNFSSVCLFDKNINKYRYLKRYKNKEVISMLEGDYDAKLD